MSRRPEASPLPCPGHILRPSLRVTPGTVQLPSPQPGTRVPVLAWLALLLHPSPWPPCPPFPHKEQLGTSTWGQIWQTPRELPSPGLHGAEALPSYTGSQSPRAGLDVSESCGRPVLFLLSPQTLTHPPSSC